MAEPGTHLTRVIAARLEPGEELRGTCIATRQSLFKGQQVAVGVTPTVA